MSPSNIVSRIRRRTFLLAAILLAACSQQEQEADTGQAADTGAGAAGQSLQARARAIHERVMTVDTHVDIPFNFATDAHDPLDADAQVNIQRMEAGGLDAAFFVVYVGQEERTQANYEAAYEDAITKFEAISRMAERYPGRISPATTAAEAREIHDSGSLVALIGVENGFTIGRDLSRLEEFRERGARYMTLVHNGHNDIGDSAQPRAEFGDGEAEHDGLSEFGARVVDEMNRLGIVVDVSHASRQAMLDATRRSRAPVMASHSSVTALADHPRNMNDEQMRALAENGGVIQIVAFDSYVKAVPEAKTAAIEALRDSLGIENPGDLDSLSEAGRTRYVEEMDAINAEWPPADVQGLADHIDYAVDLIGIEHVGISSDFGGGGGIEGWRHAGETFNVTLELVRRGYTAEEIARLWGGNVLRVLAEASAVADRLRSGGL